MTDGFSTLRAVSIALYGMFLAGLFVMFSSPFAGAAARISARARLKGIKKGLAGERPYEEPGSGSLSAMLDLAFGIKGDSSGQIFILASLVLGLVVFLILTLRFGPGLGIFGFAAFSTAPYLIMRTRLQDLRVDMSREGEQLLTELLNNYRIGHYNMREAIERTAVTIEEAPISKRMLLDLSRQLNAAAGDAQIKDAIERFRLALDTSWGDLLAANLEFAELDGIVVTESLVDLVESVGSARRWLEQTRRETSDSSMVLRILFPAMCVLIYVGATSAFGMTPAKFLHNQFGTATGVGWAVGLAFSYVLSLVASAFIARQKMDI
ncbi:MAG: hypothetical protein II617_02130 [Firmicutes bacterium]|nr:hypothetical protein [Bacillota bacterium]